MNKKSCANWKALKRSGKWNVAAPPPRPRPLRSPPQIPHCGRGLSYQWKVSIVGLLVEGGRKGSHSLWNSRMRRRLERVGTGTSRERSREKQRLTKRYLLPEVSEKARWRHTGCVCVFVPGSGELGCWSQHSFNSYRVGVGGRLSWTRDF